MNGARTQVILRKDLESQLQAIVNVAAAVPVTDGNALVHRVGFGSGIRAIAEAYGLQVDNLPPTLTGLWEKTNK